MTSGAPAMNICIVAYKDLSRNTRIARQCHSLVARGHQVVVVGLGRPDPALSPALQSVEFHDADLRFGRRLAKRLWTWLAWGGHGRTTGSEAPGGPGGAAPPASASLIHRTLARLLVAISATPLTRFAARAAALVAGRDFDIVQAHDDIALLAAHRIAGSCGGLLIYDAVELPHDQGRLPAAALRRAIRSREIAKERRILSGIASILTVSKGLARRIEQAYRPRDLVILRNCRFYESPPNDRRIRDDLTLTADDRLILYINSLWRDQGLEQAIEALPHLPQSFHFAALGPEAEPGIKAALARRATALGVAHRVHFPEPVSPSDLVAYASGADLGLIPRQGSHDNLIWSLPNRIFELIMARLPIAASRLPEIAELVEEWKIGQSFDESAPRSMAEVIMAILEKPTLDRYQQAAEKAAKGLCWEKEAESYLVLLDHLGYEPATDGIPGSRHKATLGQADAARQSELERTMRSTGQGLKAAP